MTKQLDITMCPAYFEKNAQTFDDCSLLLNATKVKKKRLKSMGAQNKLSCSTFGYKFSSNHA